MKRIVICGAGEIGRHASEILANEGYDVCVVDHSSEKLSELQNSVDVSSIVGNCCYPATIEKSDMENCDVLIAATDKDEINLLTAALAKRKGAKRVIARIHDRNFFKNGDLYFQNEFHIDHLICPENLTSDVIIGNLTDPDILGVEHFKKHQVELHRYKVQEDSGSVGKKLADLDLPEDVRVALIEREGSVPFIPKAESILAPEDIITVISKSGKFKQAQKFFSPSTRNVSKDVAILGCSSLSEWLIKELSSLDFNIRLFEANTELAEAFSAKFSDITILNRDPTDPILFREEQLHRCRAFIATGASDEHNILSALQAKKLGAKITSAIVHAPTYLSLLKNIGIDLPFSPRIEAAKELLSLIDDSSIKGIATLAPGRASLYEIHCKKGKGLNRALKELKMPPGAFIASITRGDEKIFPSAKDVLLEGDIILVVAAPNLHKRLKKIFVVP